MIFLQYILNNLTVSTIRIDFLQTNYQEKDQIFLRITSIDLVRNNIQIQHRLRIQYTKLNTEMEKIEAAKDLECILCFELPKKAISCRCCKKILCQIHVIKLNKKCPNCRAEPFAFQIEDKLQPEIDELRNRNREFEKATKCFKCFASKCTFEGHYNDMVVHQKTKHQKIPLDALLFGDGIQQIEHPPTATQKSLAQYASQNQRNPPNGERKKAVTYQQALRMVRHTRQCQQLKCKRLWSGPWGTFIGGDQGNTHFDLTDCLVGKSLNEAIGWKYGDWRS